MMTARLASVALEEKIAKFVEFLVQDYLQTKGYEETGEKFVEECATRRAARDEGPGSPDTNTPTCATLDEAADWKFLADKLALPELLRQNSVTVTGHRFTAVIEVLVKEMIRESNARSRPPSSVSKVKLSDGMWERKLVTERPSTPLSLPRSTTTALCKSTGNLGVVESNGPAVTDSEETHESPLNNGGVSRTELPSGDETVCLSTGNAEGRRTERCKASILHPIIGRLGGFTGGRKEFRRASHKHYSSKAKRLYDHSSSSKQGGRRAREAGAVLTTFQFRKDVIQRQRRSPESWIPDDLRTKMVRRSMRVIKENIFDSVAQESFERREKKHSSRSELEKVKTQEKFGTKHQRPCALCERYFSEVNLVQTVPFKVCAFCSQLFHDPLGYRPTWDMQVARQYILLHVTSENHELSKDVLSEDWPRDYTANGVFYMQLACHKIRARRH